MQKKRTQSNKSGAARATTNRAGGREFGNVIKPTQAQMASGNKGLAADSTSGSSGGPSKKPARSSRTAK